MVWRPLLVGEQASAVRAALDDITRSLAAEDVRQVHSHDLAEGAAGRVLVWNALGDSDRAARWLDRAIELVAERPSETGLFNGTAGVAVASRLVEETDDSELVDAIRGEIHDTTTLPPGHDLIEGLAGLIVFALGPHRELATELVIELCEQAELRDPGVTWRTQPHHIPDERHGRFPTGIDDMGVAHGAPGPIVALAAAFAANIEPAVARDVMRRACQWMLANRLPDGDSAFPFHREPGDAPPGRSAWCYGDPGVSRALYIAARATADHDLKATATAIAHRAFERPRDRTSVVDAGLCHGAAGLAHIANRMWQDTGDEAFATAARTWYADSLALPRPGDGAFLDGAGGLALALRAAIEPVEPTWDRLLLVSLP